MTVLDVSIADGAAWLTLDAPSTGNSITVELVRALHEGVQRARREDARVVVLRARGRAFCVGGDISGFANAPHPGQLLEDMAELLHRVVSDLHRMDAVVVAAVQGTAAGAGVSLAAAADVVLAAAGARFTLAYTKIGLTPDGGSSLLVNSLGLHRALYLALLNPLLSASQAQEAGLVSEVHPDDELELAAETIVATLLAGSRAAQVAAKRLLRGVAQPLAEASMRQESLSIAARAEGPDGREGVRAFLDRRPPAFPSAEA
jgi:2-(1,2-epoxy-1,2-dihydrophenyl)acetyl-CoA isomerase